jgi:hypothetical protein
VQIDGLGGDTITLSGHALHSNAFRLLGVGFGPVELEVYQREFTQLTAAISAITAGGMAVRPPPFPLAEVEKAWAPQGRTTRTYRQHPLKHTSLTPGTFAPGVSGLLIRTAAGPVTCGDASSCCSTSTTASTTWPQLRRTQGPAAHRRPHPPPDSAPHPRVIRPGAVELDDGGESV